MIVPWHVEQDNPDCPGGWAVVKDADSTLAGCHDTEADAVAQVKALYLNEPDMGMAAAQTGLWSLEADGDVWSIADDEDNIVSSHTSHSAAVAHLAELYGFDGCVLCMSPRHPGPCAKKKGSIQTDKGGRISREEAGRKMLGDREYERRTKNKRRRASVSAGLDVPVVEEISPTALPIPAAPPAGTGTPWKAVICVEGTPTGEDPRRIFAPGSLVWAAPPLALKWQKVEADGHDGAVIVGRIDSILRDGAYIRAQGVMDDDGVDGAEALRLAGLLMLRGVSIKADDTTDDDIEYVYPMPAVDMMPEMMPEAGVEGDMPGMEMPGMEMMMAEDPEAVIIHHARIRSATLLAEPAFVEAYIELGEPVVTAAAYTVTIPEVWPEWWFDEPADTPPIGALHITPEGRVYGYLGPDRVAHRAFRASGQKVTIPRGVDYSEFQNKPCLVAGGDGQIYRINAGNITFDCGHPSPFDGRRADPSWAMQHYDNTCSIAARVRVGENRYGTWVAGGLLHGITADAFERMMACALSGDWQGGRLNAALLVPVEGFPVGQTSSVRVRDDALVASTVPIRYVPDGAGPDMRPTLERLARSIGRDRTARFNQLRHRVKGEVT